MIITIHVKYEDHTEIFVKRGQTLQKAIQDASKYTTAENRLSVTAHKTTPDALGLYPIAVIPHPGKDKGR